uniref:dynactin subunit 1-like n=1 Tax=Bombus vancouverensis nearcticus TaxID=2705178 RepID=UPI001439975E|nr:dynactin subunit 1-like [Bombus vancouverensis nearcticus]
MESASAKVEMLRGEENWLQRRFVMRTLLEEDDDLINVCEGNLCHPGNSAEKEIARGRFLKADRLARKLIVTSVGKKPLDLLLCCTTAHEMWKKLNTVYDMKSDENLNMVQKQFFDFKWEESENVSYNLSKLELIAAKMKALGSEIGEKMLITRILSVLPNKFDHFHSAWDSVEEEKKTLDRLSTRLMTEEIRWKKDDQETSVALVTKGNNYKREQQKQSSKREYEKQGPSCFNCGKVGHLKKDCFRCFICKRKGHTSRNCFKNNKRSNSKDNQELLSQAAKAFELIEEQKEASSRNQAQYQQSLENERKKIRRLEKELAEYEEKKVDASIFYKEAFDITPEKALENEEKLCQMEELVASLEAEVKQVTNSLDEERVWAQELEGERDEFRERLESETRLRENLDAERLQDIESLREKVKELEEQQLKRDTVVQQCKPELLEKERIIKEKNAQLEERCRVYEELNAVSEKRKKQVDQLRTSIKARDEALTDLNNKHRALLSQFENGYVKRSPPSSSSAMNSVEDPLQARMGQKMSCVQGITKRGNTCLDWEPNRERSTRVKSRVQTLNGEIRDIRDLIKELEEKEKELKAQEESRKQLVLKLCNTQKQAETMSYKLKKLEGEHEKAIKTIQGFMERQQQLENTKLRKEQKIEVLEILKYMLCVDNTSAVKLIKNPEFHQRKFLGRVSK